MRGVVLYQGKSRIDGKPIVLIATLRTSNPKTGDMVQTWILRADVSPVEAINTGDDYSICGKCPLRGRVEDGSNRGRSCYVSVCNAPLSVWNAYKNGAYPVYDPAAHAHLFAGRKIRLGSYGDPAAVPLTAWKPILALSGGWSGYTHQWKQSRFKRWARYVMASTHTTKENDLAAALGFRTFRTIAPGAALAANEIACPASEEAGYRRTCETCLACDGGRAEKRSVAIVGHGGTGQKRALLKALDVIQ